MTTYLKDYCPYPYQIPEITLFFDLDPQHTRVKACYKLIAENRKKTADIILFGAHQTLESVMINDRALSKSSYTLTDQSLVIPASAITYSGEHFTLSVTSHHSPEKNLTLQGLYTSGGILTTQCEPTGMRHITYHPDRPDLLSRYRVTLRAKKNYKYLLSNGNLEKSSTNGEFQEVTWVDPHPKPSYLFALVAGDFDLLEETLEQERQGKSHTVTLQIYTPREKSHRAKRAMQALKKAMIWDKQVYDRSYDLDRFMIVAVDDFNAGAMENKGLNIFNAPQILSDPSISEDEDFLRIDRIVAHEYFHNWTGNRITLRDWFQLTLKEGLTVFREQQFNADVHDSALERLSEIAYMTSFQFREDRSALSHPILPKQYDDIDNFYTCTVYDKGAEVVRMLYLLLGKKRYFEAMQSYFSKFDGKAITALDFFHHLSSFSDRDLSQFESWYHTKGTPKVIWSLDGDLLSLEQLHSGSEGSNLLIPLRIQVYADDGSTPISFSLDGGETLVSEDTSKDVSKVLIFSTSKAQLRIRSEYSTSLSIALNVGFSAPVLLEEKTQAASPINDRLFLFARDHQSPVLQGQSCHEIFKASVLSLMQEKSPLTSLDIHLRHLLDSCKSSSLKRTTGGYCLKFPSFTELLAEQNPMRIEETEQSANQLQDHIATAHQEQMLDLYKSLEECLLSEQSLFEQEHCSLRSLACSLIHFVARTDRGEEILEKHLDIFSNRTLHLKGLALALQLYPALGKKYLDLFYECFHKDPLTITKWFSLQASCPTCRVATIEKLKAHPLFDHKRPRMVRACISTFIQNIAFSREYKTSYPWLIEQVLRWDKNNPHLAASFLSPFKEVEQMTSNRKKLAYSQLKQLLDEPSLSQQTQEIAAACVKKAH